MIVKVIVDIPTQQVDRPFDYLVPSELEAMIEIGIRVQVPFGVRQVMAIVVEIVEESDYEGKLKPISKVLDYMSFLNEELVALSATIASEIFTFRINILQAMLPSMLRVKYENYFHIEKPTAFLDLTADYLDADGTEVYASESLVEVLPAKLLKKLLNDDIIKVEYRVKDQVTTKTITYIDVNQTADDYMNELERLNKNSKKQALLLQDLIENRDQYIMMKQNDFLNHPDYNRRLLNIAIENQWLKKVVKEVYRDPLANQHFEPSYEQTLTNDQMQAFTTIEAARQAKKATTFLLEGVTGSGKTEVYLQLMQRARQDGQSAIFLVPEIALTPQMVERVKSRFQTGIAVLHSALSVSERYDEWRRIIKGEATIVVGARSSIFAPLKNIGLIVIDEEHESTYKQADNPRYHARDVAIWRSEYHHCPVILGSATPSLETRSRAEVGRYQLLRLPKRINERALPQVDLVDMSKIVGRFNNDIFSPSLIDKIQHRLDAKEQIILLLNKRGYASYMLCRDCGHVLQCPRCDISLTYHKSQEQMKCHYCDYHSPVPHHCPNCHSHNIRTYGIGTQKVAETIEELFPQAKTIRMDIDTTRGKGQHEKLLTAFSHGQADILLGTQMIAKGLDFEKVTLVGVINADTALHLPDFRASERTFQLMTQVAGRAGRGRYQGEVIVQTYNPDHYVMQLVKQQDYERYFYTEMQRRHMANYPPYFYITSLTVSSKFQNQAHKKIYELKSQIFEAVNTQQVIILGPSNGPAIKKNNYYYYQIILKYKNKDFIQQELKTILSQTQADIRQGIFVSIDHEPQFFI
ncbi:primosomal protein N' [Fundicoccus culcitae]|uniref:Replication restart protein PriA n=1 Tax=Fundicoccus culcitae TaxID=2969821 RepID=A0ABY5P698_9LACT|nr:primosomal protein N' [Fundicoccus culcitae]UUX34079.1 primosomal protein N' [Fundicoccus culcitae]